jgi:hypothetical protein
MCDGFPELPIKMSVDDWASCNQELSFLFNLFLKKNPVVPLFYRSKKPFFLRVVSQWVTVTPTFCISALLPAVPSSSCHAFETNPSFFSAPEMYFVTCHDAIQVSVFMIVNYIQYTHVHCRTILRFLDNQAVAMSRCD